MSQRQLQPVWPSTRNSDRHQPKSLTSAFQSDIFPEILRAKKSDSGRQASSDL